MKLVAQLHGACVRRRNPSECEDVSRRAFTPFSSITFGPVTERWLKINHATKQNNDRR
jgi:hypothetical protein